MVVNIKLSGEGLSFEGETDLLGAGQVIAFLNKSKEKKNLDGSLKSDPLLLSMDAIVPRNVGTPREALFDSGAKTNSEKIVTLVKYIIDRNSVESVSVQEIQIAFKKAGEPLPRNFSRDLKDTITIGYIYEIDSGDGYRLSDMGIQAVNSKFEKGATPMRAKKSKAINPAGKVREEIKNLEVLPTYSGMNDFYSLATKGKKILWLIAYAMDKGIESVTPAEVHSLGEKLRENLPPSSFTALTDRIVKDGFIYKSGEGYKINQKGLDSLKVQKA
jgi:hypothetical protein